MIDFHHTGPGRLLGGLLFFIPVFLAGCSRGDEVLHRVIDLAPAQVFNGYLARNVCLDKESGAVVLDYRKIKGDEPLEGLIETDVLDLFDILNESIGIRERPQRIELTCWAEAPPETSLELYTSFSDGYFSKDSWSDWELAPGLLATIENPPGRYLRVRIKLLSEQPGKSPLLEGLQLGATWKRSAARWKDSLKIKLYQNPSIIRSPVHFGYERCDQPAVSNFVERNRLRELVAECKSEMDTLVTLLHWVARVKNTRHGRIKSPDYPWDIEKIVSYDQSGQPSIEGHCMSYAVAYITALTGLGFTARHWAVQGFRFADHEVVEVWSNSLGKWVYFDPSLDHYYVDKTTREPLSILELHRVFVNTFFADGENLRMPMDLQRERVRKIGGKNVPIDYVSGHYAYGKPNPDYDWGWFHGYLACGFMRLTTRNDFHSRKEPWFPHFGEGVHDFDRFLSWSDEKTPVSPKITLFSERERDFYWTLNQAQIKAVRAGPALLELEFGHSMPFFDTFLISVDENPFSPGSSKYSWQLHQGENRLVVLPRNEWGRTGTGARLQVILH